MPPRRRPSESIAETPSILIAGAPKASPAWCKYCQRRGWRPLLAGSGQGALDLLVTHAPLAFVIPTELPDMTVQDFCERIRAYDSVLRYAPILVSGTDDDGAARDRAVMAGADGYIPEAAHAAVLEQDMTHWMSTAFDVRRALERRSRPTHRYNGPYRRNTDSGEPKT